MAENLPVADPETIRVCEQEYLSLSGRGGSQAAEACFRYTWALCHSGKARDNRRGVQLAETAEAARMDAAAGSEISTREFKYVRAVGLLKLREYSKARDVCASILRDSPNCKQAETLKGIVEDIMVREGLLGAGIIAAAASVAVVGLVSLLRKS
mmetsp:Transcript_11998/g.28455  ORF Transcript_11998/g.28455 Transcript_11998/m.28455 type:complete len:154 (+) Transcript_11998:140-601(+)